MTVIIPSDPAIRNAEVRREIDEYRLSPANDAFGRARVGLPATLFASSHQYSESPNFWQSKLAGTGTATFRAAQACVDMTVVADGDAVIRQTRRHFRYLPGKSQVCLLTGVIGTAVENVTKRWGYFDGDNGLFFQQDGDGTVSIGRRSSVSGSPVDMIVPQSEWNLFRLDGQGQADITLDVSQANIYVIDFEWLGVGRQRWGVNIDGMTYYVHEENWANAHDSVYMTTANLPVRYEIEATGTPATTATLKQICSTVVSEGGSDAELQTRIRSANNGNTPVSASTRGAILTIRPKATFGGLVNRAQITPAGAEFINTGNAAVLVELVRGGTVAGSPVWTSAGADSTVEYSVTPGAVTGGEVLWSGYVASANQGGRLNVPFDGLRNSDIPLTLDMDGANPQQLSIVVTSLGAATNTLGALTWREVY